ncbi:PREDICTED: E3 ubiquitin-protein ligase PUB24-like [Nicotiana attenuata]|uniref:U-box domain-containing protein n=1 Tax=Nicotiana attenuata TaxID=49451 RepID=A0A1J6JWW0_NICAT|nr:PREDICTED: E3 ubiquitin-protein ligase PUB24-like [Nicotiana attenuata]OIT22242.1 e3 ubiquitin-protein ligase pub24 [Nicotiana attenuata]
MEEVEIPQYFLCPISLQIMKDPVTTVTGITYDRQSIEQWLLMTDENIATCPVTKQPLPRDIELLTPNHMLGRLIRSWTIGNAENGIEQIPSPKYPMNKSHVIRLIRQMNNRETYVEALRKMGNMVSENEKNKKCLNEAGAIKAMVCFILRSFKEGKLIVGLEEALRIFHLVWSPTHENKQLVKENHDLIEAILCILKSEMINNNNNNQVVIIKTHAIMVLKNVISVSSSNLLSSLTPEFFQEMLNILHKNSKNKVSQQATKAALHVLIDACPRGRNRLIMIELGAIFELIELELSNNEKRVTELVFSLLLYLCSLADGRAELVKHAAGIAVISKRILRISPATDDSAIQILGLISKFSATKQVLIEMLRVGAVSKLCMVIQAHGEAYLKKKAMEILRAHSNVWSNSPCVQIYLLTRYPGQYIEL